MFASPKKDSFDTIIAEQTQLEGEIITPGDIYIGGVISGQIKAKNIQLGPSAKIEANVEAENIVINGEVKGAIKAKEKLEITETGKMMGDIDIKILSIASGAVFDGQCNMAPEAKEGINTEGIDLAEKFSLKDNAHLGSPLLTQVTEKPIWP